MDELDLFLDAKPSQGDELDAFLDARPARRETPEGVPMSGPDAAKGGGVASELLRAGARTVRSGVSGALGLVDVVENPVRQTIAAGLQGVGLGDAAQSLASRPSYAEGFRTGFDYLTNNAAAPRSASEGRVDRAVEFVGGAMAPAAAVSKVAPATESVVTNALRFMAPKTGTDVAGAAAAGFANKIAEDNDLGPVATLATTLAAGTAPSLIKSGSGAAARGVGRAVKSVGAVDDVAARELAEQGFDVTAMTAGKDGAGASFVRGYLRNTFIGGKMVEGAGTRAAAQGAKAADDVIGNIGNALDAAGAGERLISGLEAGKRAFNTASSSLYNEADKLLPQGFIRVSNLKDAVNSVDDRLSGLKWQQVVRSKDIQQLADDTLTAIKDASAKGRTNVDTMKAVRSNIGKLMDEAPFKSPEQRFWSRAYGALSKDLEEAAKGGAKGAVEAVKKANDFYRTGRREIEKQFMRYGGKKEVEDAFKALASPDALRNAPQRVTKLFERLPQGSRKTVGATLIRRLGQKVDGGDFDLLHFATKWEAVAPKARAAIANGAENATEIDKLVRNIRRVQPTLEAIPATGQVAAGRGSDIAAVGGLFFAPWASAAKFAMDGGLGWLLTRPQNVRLLNNAVEKQSTSTLQVAIRSMLQDAPEGEAKNLLQRTLDQVKQGGQTIQRTGERVVRETDGFVTNPIGPKGLPMDTGMKAYHATDSVPFDIFDPSKAVKGERYFNPLGDGMYVSTNKDFARRFGKNMMEGNVPKDLNILNLPPKRANAMTESIGRAAIKAAGKGYDSLPLMKKVEFNRLWNQGSPIENLNALDDFMANGLGIKNSQEIIQSISKKRFQKYDAVRWGSTDYYDKADEIALISDKAKNAFLGKKNQPIPMDTASRILRETDGNSARETLGLLGTSSALGTAGAYTAVNMAKDGEAGTRPETATASQPQLPQQQFTTKPKDELGDLIQRESRRDELGDLIGSLQSQPASSDVSPDILNKIAMVESSGNPNAKAKTSSATGLHQFTSGTWLNIIEKYEPELARGKAKSDLLRLRKNPAVSERMAGYLVQENSNILKKLGAPVNDASLYLAHFAGAETAAKALNANPNAPAIKVFGPAAVRANPRVLKGKRVGEVIAWAERKMGT
jgi:hypothetical protein